MSDGNEILDKDNMLTSKGKELVQLALLDEKQSQAMFNAFRTVVVQKMQSIVAYEEQILGLGKFSPEKTHEVVKAMMLLFTKMVRTYYVDMGAFFDFLELVNKNDIFSNMPREITSNCPIRRGLMLW